MSEALTTSVASALPPFIILYVCRRRQFEGQYTAQHPTMKFNDNCDSEDANPKGNDDFEGRDWLASFRLPGLPVVTVGFQQCLTTFHHLLINNDFPPSLPVSMACCHADRHVYVSRMVYTRTSTLPLPSTHHPPPLPDSAEMHASS